MQAVPRSEEDMATNNGIDQDIPPEVMMIIRTNYADDDNGDG